MVTIVSRVLTDKKLSLAYTNPALPPFLAAWVHPVKALRADKTSEFQTANDIFFFIASSRFPNGEANGVLQEEEKLKLLGTLEKIV